MSQQYLVIANLSSDELEIYLKELDHELNSVANDAQLTHDNLQKALIQQQKTMDELITIAKTLHVTSMVMLNRQKA